MYVCKEIGKLQDRFSKFWKNGKRSSKNWNIRKKSKQMNGAIEFNLFLKSLKIMATSLASALK